MSTFEVPSPILNSPFAEPKEHGWILEGQPGGGCGQIAVEMIDPRGNDLLVVKRLEETK